MQDMWDSQRKATGVIGDRPQGDRKAVRKTTFTRWMNVFLQKCDPPLEVCDLFTDIQDGRILMALLEELSGCKLLYRFRPSSHHIFRLNNISKALAFLDDRHVKLLDIDASSIADGIPSVVLNLVWNIILHFQVKEVTGGLQRHMSSSLSSLSLSKHPSTSDLSPPPNDDGSYSCNSLPTKGRKTSMGAKYYSKAVKTFLQWVQRCTSKYGVDVDDFGTSWRSGLAFLALIKSINPDLVNLRESLSREPEENVKQAFMLAHHSLGVPPLLEPEDVLSPSPDEQSIITYVSMFLGHLSGADEDCTRNMDLPETPNFGSPDPVSFGETLPDTPDAQALLNSFEKSNEQQLWRRWSRRFSGTSSSPRRAFPPPSPLDACIVNQEIRSWMEKGLDQGSRKKRAEGSRVSLSSEEGIYSLSALDSDEEDAYSYILDLNKEVFHPYHQPKRPVPKVEEETAEQMKEESKHLEEFGLCSSSGCPQQEGPPDEDTASNFKSEVGSQSAGHRKFDLDKNKVSPREASNTTAVFDLEPKGENRNKELEESALNSDDQEERGQKTISRHDKTTDDGVNKISVEAAGWRKDAVKGEEGKLSENQGNVSERRRAVGELRGSEEGRDLRKDGVNEEETASQRNVYSGSFKVEVNERILTADVANDARQTDAARVNTEKASDRKDNVTKTDLTKNKGKMEEAEHVMKSSDYEHKDLTTTDQNGGTAPTKPNDDIQDGDSSQRTACSASSQSFSIEGGLSLQSFAASCDITPLELEMLLVLWILLYCYLILPQMNL
ncbi:uncharacterized protein zgc:100997 [Kryptolebias marmoratus]|uniref:Calmin n=1 Tax=Kryptolebias marmoratus TaxID=37003 RepID=A0A3Q3ETD3_KRYMA|nr:uncharacterized protein zgc:100997 [Kryptolebias marmoratus]